MTSLRTPTAHSRSHSRHRRRRTLPASPSRYDLYLYHRQFADQVRKCAPPIAGSQKTQPADVNGGSRLQHQLRPTLSHRPISKLRYHVDTGTNRTVFPSRLLPERMIRIDYSLYAARETTIPTYGCDSRSFNLGQRLNFT